MKGEKRLIRLHRTSNAGSENALQQRARDERDFLSSSSWYEISERISEM
jgi:hypothetical protein